MQRSFVLFKTLLLTCGIFCFEGSLGMEPAEIKKDIGSVNIKRSLEKREQEEILKDEAGNNFKEEAASALNITSNCALLALGLSEDRELEFEPLLQRISEDLNLRLILAPEICETLLTERETLSFSHTQPLLTPSVFSLASSDSLPLPSNFPTVLLNLRRQLIEINNEKIATELALDRLRFIYSKAMNLTGSNVLSFQEFMESRSNGRHPQASLFEEQLTLIKSTEEKIKNLISSSTEGIIAYLRYYYLDQPNNPIGFTLNDENLGGTLHALAVTHNIRVNLYTRRSNGTLRLNQIMPLPEGLSTSHNINLLFTGSSQRLNYLNRLVESTSMTEQKRDLESGKEILAKQLKKDN